MTTGVMVCFSGDSLRALLRDPELKFSYLCMLEVTVSE